MRIKFGSRLIQLYFNPDPKLNPRIPFMAAHSQPLSAQSFPTIEEDDTLCSSEASVIPTEIESAPLGDPNGYLTGAAHIERAWSHWKKLGCPKLVVAPMVDNSELPFRLLCRKYGAQAAYTPMLHSRIFSENQKYRAEEFTTCKVCRFQFQFSLLLACNYPVYHEKFAHLIQARGWYIPETGRFSRARIGEDRPLFVQFCANDPDVLLEAARRVEPYCDYVDINFGCPQRIARRGNYGAFLMDNLPLVRSLVEKLSKNLNVPVSCKIRIFPDLQDTINYAKMLEDAGCSLLAVHGRTRDEKDGKKFRANWNAIRTVRDAVRIPVLANGNIRHMDDAWQCIEETGVEGVLSAESLLENPAMFGGYRTAEWVHEDEENTQDGKLDQGDLLVEYLKFCEKYPVPWRMVRSHVHKMLGDWFRLHPNVRNDLNSQYKLTFEFLYDIVNRLRELGVQMPLKLSGNGSSV